MSNFVKKNKIKINIYSGNSDPLGMQFFDILFAYNQSLGENNQSDWDFVINNHDKDINLNIALLSIFDQECVTLRSEKFDLILLCNASEPLSVFNHDLFHLLNLDKTYILSNSYLKDNHALKNKVVWFPFCIIQCNDYWFRSFYPQIFKNHILQNLKRENKLIAINGQNRAHRRYFFDLLSKSDADLKILSNIHSAKSKLLDSGFESSEDSLFRDFVNSKLSTESDNNDENKIDYYQESTKVGIDGKFGLVPPAYFLMQEYFENTCVVFPESSWQNSELAVTEKIAKCFYSESIPFPIGGSDINYLYNDLGYQTAWNLLPNELKKFDREKNHSYRYQKAVEAIRWLDQNRDVFLTQTCNDIRTENKKKFFENSMIIVAVKKLHQLISTLLQQVEIDKHQKLV